MKTSSEHPISLWKLLYTELRLQNSDSRDIGGFGTSTHVVRASAHTYSMYVCVYVCVTFSINVKGWFGFSCDERERKQINCNHATRYTLLYCTVIIRIVICGRKLN